MSQKETYTNEKNLFLSLIKADQNFQENFLNNLHDGIFFLNPDQRITFWNDGAERITGHLKSDAIGERCAENILICVNEYGESLCNKSCPISQTLENGNIHESEVFLHHKEGSRLPIIIRSFPFQDEKGTITGVVGIFYDNSPKVVMPQRIRELAQMSLLDPLTEVGNKRFLEMHLNSRIKETQKYQVSPGALFIDIDNFKNINEEHGQKVGDKILKMVAQTLLNSIRFFDVVGRWGGEEFIVVILNVNESRLNLVANKLRLLVSQSSIMDETRLLGVTVSIGATIAKSNDTVESLVKRAESLTYQSKKLGKNRVSTTLNSG